MSNLSSPGHHRRGIAAATMGASAAVVAVLAGAAATQQASTKGLLIALGVATVVAGALALRLAHRAGVAESRAVRDPLTGLPNRTLLNDRLEQALQFARRTDDSFAVMVVDLDGFKEVNDIRGHEAGDQVLQSIAHRLDSVARASDTVARVGGDEFVVLSLGTRTEDEAEGLVARFREALRRPYRVDGGMVEIDASIGWAIFPADGASPEQLLERADGQMFATKRKTDDGFEMSRRGSLDAGIVREFEVALKRGEIIVHYQPMLQLRSGEVRGVEALVRRRHPQRGLLQPSEFIPHVERTPMIRALTLHVAADALAAAQTWRSHAGRIGVSVNVPLRIIDDPALVDGLLELHDATGAGSGLLTLEVIPSGAGVGGEIDREVVERLTSAGIRLSLDDFGRSSSLVALRALPLSEVKIDGRFVRGVARGRTDRAVAQNLINLAHDLGLETVAEGVETRAAWDTLAELGCEAVQGHYIQPALAADKVTEWLTNSWPAVAIAG